MALFERRCAELGATTNEQRAELAGVDWTTIWRWGRGEISPRLDAARRVAGRLEIRVDDLFPPAA